MFIRTVFLILCIFTMMGCSKKSSYVFAVPDSKLALHLDTIDLDENKRYGPTGNKTLPIRLHRLVSSPNSWIIGIRQYEDENYFLYGERLIEKITLLFEGSDKPSGEFNLRDRDNIRVIYSRISTSYLSGCAAEAEFGKVLIEWLTEKRFKVSINTGFDMKLGTFCDPAVINNIFVGDIKEFDSLSPWDGRAEVPSSFDDIRKQLTPSLKN